MKLYVCWGTFSKPVGGDHPCRVAHEGLTEAGYRPDVIKSYGLRQLPDALNFTSGRREAKKLTGKTDVPVLVTDDDEIVSGSRTIADWARANPASSS